ncbi:XRE family transcriptional regulator [Vibrio cholerae]|uniref:LexA family transcriptional regulator n=1 Tax=Vibrio cholerae TaxID=666 RepID=UPI000903CA0D|nr:XRE family transcriptional regulator [Vibrio cholerae]APF70685.1 transcriptional regulator [Vibrio cholerae]EGQ9843158.1 XRE family transcriptional regulator [Vibrio cholerae]EJL6357334.1 XRE family transcriptional regulator [Vibrio cholerae]ELJ8546289.1 XRE family transcriptional regulator [Vibrio cholerae]ELY5189194.1 XRE family transcriptional regulator [Vibrio cholerae]
MSDTYNKNAAGKDKNADHIFEIKGIMRFPERLKEAIGDISIRSFAKKCGLSEAVVRNYLGGKTFPSLDKLALISEISNKPLEWLCSGATTDYSVSEPSAFYSIPMDEFVMIPGYRIQVSAGHGALNPENMEPTRYLAFRRKWLNYRGFNEKDLAIVWAKGDSMEPTIHNNDTLVVHMARNKPQDGHIYIFRNGDELFVKRYQSMLGTWRLISDNAFYSPVDIPKQEQHQFDVVGQVVHIAKDIGD